MTGALIIGCGDDVSLTGTTHDESSEEPGTFVAVKVDGAVVRLRRGLSGIARSSCCF